MHGVHAWKGMKYEKLTMNMHGVHVWKGMEYTDNATNI